MKTAIPKAVTDTEDGRIMADILKSCVHCGMCNATCPTYQLRGDELDGPRGRIYLIKAMLEGEDVTVKTQQHLDRCLTCRSCETTCPSGVAYGHLVELARPRVEQQVKRGSGDRFQRWLIRQIVPHRQRFNLLLKLGQLLKPLLPTKLAELIPRTSTLAYKPSSLHARTMLILEGCAQASVAPSINQAARQVFDKFDISLHAPKDVGCCGAVSYHLGDVSGAKALAKKNIDLWLQSIDSGAEALLVASSGCAAMIKDYPSLFSEHEPHFAQAKKLAEAVKDPSEVLDPKSLKEKFPAQRQHKRIAFQAPCSMQHSTHTDGSVERCLEALGYELSFVPEAHLCCGSAGSYSLLQPELSAKLLDRKLQALSESEPSLIATANIGCMMHLARRAEVPVQHWLELVAAESKD